MKILAGVVVVLMTGGVMAESPYYFRAGDAADYEAGIASIRDLQHGDLYAMTWKGDHHLDRVIDANCPDTLSAFSFICANILDHAPAVNVVTGMGCSAFSAKNAAGETLVGRNFDYRFPMAHVLLHMPRDERYGRRYASVGTVDAGFVGFDVGSLKNITDTKAKDYPWHAALFPFVCMDGMNEAGFMITVLSLDARPKPNPTTEQFVPGRKTIVPSLAIRYLLDRAGSTAEGVAMMTNFNMSASSGPNFPVQANYHFLLSDRSGDARVIEWLPPAKKGESWIPFVTNATHVTNFYLADGFGHGNDRYDKLDRKLAETKGRLEASEAMDLCRAVSQPKGASQTSWTHWSVVYNLNNLTAEIATLGHYDEIFPYRLKGSDAWEIGPMKR